MRDLLVEMNDLKRVRSAGRVGSIAERLFAQGWSALTSGAPAEDVALDVAATALAATRLCDLDAAFLAAAGLPDGAVSGVLVEGFDSVTTALDPHLRDALRDRLRHRADHRQGTVPGFVAALAQQPRAGVTCPGRPRILLEPPENHAEHCLVVAVYGVVLSPFYRADPATVFLAAMAHHFHNAAMPDAGFTGEILLGDHLGPIMARTTQWALDELDGPLRESVERARAVLPDDATAEGRAFHAADCIDRVLQIAQHLRAASLTMGTVLDEMELVHAGPVKGFHDRVLADMRIP
ncbi:HD domain-containing protein [Methylobacterium sp. WL30]|uniref:HD domain-containing protein n=1 Tax=unclassified Methylobacterium TaxID=2615210 RepID=UPI0011C876AC|nr:MULTISPECIES: HD domain-containing protein [unclassified Methylobacterium]TXN36401.1 HD domain-containing protein [Methylobacterium sp. WL93]TXN48659.1 HD domain-containing protein [Methylobacterium sp. WL119]TXN66184.1 HD domain-containing protein [Methylobacterium sp. WL30]